MRISESERFRFVVCHNPGGERDAAVRERLLARLTEMIAGSDGLSDAKRAEMRGVILTRPDLACFLRTTAGRRLRNDEGAIKAEEKLDGKYLLRSSDPTLSAEDIALGSKQLAEVERGWRDMKQVLDLRPACHRREDRIRALMHLRLDANLLAGETCRDREHSQGPFGSIGASGGMTPQ